MVRFDIYRNDHAPSGKRFPYLLCVQSDLLDGMETCVVVPLGRASLVGGKLAGALTPVLEVDGENWVMYTPELAAVRVTILRKHVGNLHAQAPAILAALDFLFHGI